MTLIQELPTITYVETRSVGHYPEWVRAITEAFSRLKPACRLHVWVPRDFQALHSSWAEGYFSSSEDAAVRITCYDSLFKATHGTQREQSSILELNVILRCAEADRARVCYIARLDGQLRNIALGRFNSMRAKLVGLLDQPYLHYGKIGNRKKQSRHKYVCLLRNSR